MDIIRKLLQDKIWISALVLINSRESNKKFMETEGKKKFHRKYFYCTRINLYQKNLFAIKILRTPYLCRNSRHVDRLTKLAFSTQISLEINSPLPTSFIRKIWTPKDPLGGRRESSDQIYGWPIFQHTCETRNFQLQNKTYSGEYNQQQKGKTFLVSILIIFSLFLLDFLVTR